MSKLLEKVICRVRVRTWLCLLLLIANAMLAYGAALYYNLGGGPVLYGAGIVLTIVVGLILAVPNTSPEPKDRDSMLND